MWDMFSTHLTYDVKQQCFIIPKVLTRLQDALDVPDRLQVVAGDMNTYMTAEWPMDFWQNPWGSFSPSCQPLLRSLPSVARFPRKL